MRKQALTLIALLFGLSALAQPGAPVLGQCPQPRFTGKAPQEIHDQVNPPANAVVKMSDEQIWQVVSFLRTLAPP